MTNSNNNNINNFVPEFIKKPTRAVSYFNETEWNKDLSLSEIAKRDKLAELEYQDRVLNGPQFGPGNEQSRKTAGEVVGGVLAITTALNPPLGMIATASVAASGGVVAAIADSIGDEEAKDQATEVFIVPAAVNAVGIVANEVGNKALGIGKK